jgi:hypothetical protein
MREDGGQAAGRYLTLYSVAGLEDRDAAFHWLNEAYNARNYLLAIYLKTDSRLDALRADPRFIKLRREIGLSLTSENPKT